MKKNFLNEGNKKKSKRKFETKRIIFKRNEKYFLNEMKNNFKCKPRQSHASDIIVMWLILHVDHFIRPIWLED